MRLAVSSKCKALWRPFDAVDHRSFATGLDRALRALRADQAPEYQGEPVALYFRFDPADMWYPVRASSVPMVKVRESDRFRAPELWATCVEIHRRTASMFAMIRDDVAPAVDDEAVFAHEHPSLPSSGPGSVERPSLGDSGPKAPRGRPHGKLRLVR